MEYFFLCVKELFLEKDIRLGKLDVKMDILNGTCFLYIIFVLLLLLLF